MRTMARTTIRAMTAGWLAVLLFSAPAPRAAAVDDTPPAAAMPGERAMDLGAFSVSLSVRDLAASRLFYEKLGFRVRGGDPARNWLVMKNGTTVIGLFQGMFPRNMLTFNPGWDGDAKKIADFEDVRTLQKRLKAQGVTSTNEVDEKTKGPASFVVIDPDGNPILVDQHV